MSDHDPAHLAARREAVAERDHERRALDEEFSSFYRATVPELIGFLINNGASLPVAADLAQDTMIKAYQRWTEIGHPRAWAHTVASRALGRRIADVREQPVDHVPEPTSLLPDPGAAAEWEVRHDVRPLLDSLPPRQRQIMAWTLNGWTPSEIADELSMNPEAVRASLKKARRAAAAYYREREGER